MAFQSKLKRLRLKLNQMCRERLWCHSYESSNNKLHYYGRLCKGERGGALIKVNCCLTHSWPWPLTWDSELKVSDSRPVTDNTHIRPRHAVFLVCEALIHIISNEWHIIKHVPARTGQAKPVFPVEEWPVSPLNQSKLTARFILVRFGWTKNNAFRSNRYDHITKNIILPYCLWK